MKNNFQFLKLSMLLFVLPLTGCGLINGTSSGASSFVSEDGSSNSGSSENVSLTWPSEIINQTFTAAARLSIPAFVSTSPFYYEVTEDILPGLRIATYVGEADGVSTYSQQLVSAVWNVYEEYRVTQQFVLGIDTSREMMILFSITEQTMFFEIANLDQDFIDQIAISQSQTWPQEAIALALGETITSVVPPCESVNNFYYFVSQTQQIAVFTPANSPTDDQAYSTVLAGAGWIIIDDYYADLAFYFAYDIDRQVMVMYGIVEGFMMLLIEPFDESIIPVDSDEVITTTWPSAQINSVLTAQPSITIPSFESLEYRHLIVTDDFGPRISIYATLATDLTESYGLALSSAGWILHETVVDTDTYTWAIDEAKTTMIVYLYFEGKFYVVIRDYHIELEPGYGAAEAAFWPTEAVAVFFENYTIGVPSYPYAEGLLSSYEFVTGDFRAFNIDISSVTLSSLATYTEQLVEAGYIVLANDVDLKRMAYDPSSQILVMFSYENDTLKIQAKPYNFIAFSDYYTNNIIENDTEFPMWLLSANFTPTLGETVPACESLGGYSFYTTWSTSFPVTTIQIPQATPTSVNDYLTVLTTAGWTIISQTSDSTTLLDPTNALQIMVTYESGSGLMILKVSFVN